MHRLHAVGRHVSGVLHWTERTATTPATRTDHLHLSATELDADGQLVGLIFSHNEEGIALEQHVLVEDDAPAVGKPEHGEDKEWFEPLTRGVVIRKTLILDQPGGRSATLLFLGKEAEMNGHSLHIRVNGQCVPSRPPTMKFAPAAKQYYTSEWVASGLFDNWFAAKVPVEALRAGPNDIELFADGGWVVMVAAASEYPRGAVDSSRTVCPGRSAKSKDNGRTFHTNTLGSKCRLDGEYSIRLSVDRSRPQGQFMGAVIDLASLECDLKVGATVPVHATVVEATLSVQVDIPEQTSGALLVRQGVSCSPDDSEWSPFARVDGWQWSQRRTCGDVPRYLQFAVQMRSQNPLATPVLLSAHVSADVVKTVVAKPLRILQIANGRVLRPSLPFAHENFSAPALREMRLKFRLDDVVQGATDEFEAQLKVMEWAYRVRLKGFDPYAWSYDLPDLDENGEPTLLPPYNQRRRQGHCLYCNLCMIGAFLSMGWPARWVNISAIETYGHEVCEVWSNVWNKWVFMDATRDYYAYCPETGVPLDLIEMNERLTEVMPSTVTREEPAQHWIGPNDELLLSARIAYRNGDHAHHIIGDTGSEGGAHHLLLMKGHLQMVRRNDFASRPHPVPWRVSSNWGGDQLQCWAGSNKFPPKPEYAVHTSRKQDFSPPLNQAELRLTQTADLTVRVDVDTSTPGFETFMVCEQEGEWVEQPLATWKWKLRADRANILEVRVRNCSAVLGPVSRVVVQNLFSR